MLKQSTSKFARAFSLEATRPTENELAELAGIVPLDTPLYLTSVATQTNAQLVALAAAVRRTGFEPVVHLAARRIAGAPHLNELLRGLRGEADMRRALVIAGDVETAGPYPDALSIIQSGKLREAGIEEIGLAGYPEGHPRIAADRIEIALDQKLAAARAAGLRVHIVSQFSFAPEAIVAWVKRMRKCGIAAPIRVGMAGPTSLPALLRYARLCGVRASLKGLMSGTAAGLLGHVGPDRIIDALAAADGLADIAPHYFSFGGALATARYARDAAGLAMRGRATA
ncbi:MAG TPA: methylenetetrahydrofolate reductase [Pseudolabrys sp.]|nr:methylenetetrahydrofolate reductase [Pseudolabrys sp.]